MSNEKNNNVRSSFRDWIAEVNAKPTVMDRVRHSGVDFLLWIAGFQAGNIIINKAMDLDVETENMLSQSRAILDAPTEMITNQQLDFVTMLHDNARTLMELSDDLHTLSWGAAGVGILAGLQLTYNATMVAVETIIDIRRG